MAHDWTNWEQYEVKAPLGELFRKMDEEGYIPTKFNASACHLEDQLRQKRRCKACGYTQDKEVRAW
jgi:hypothetical protein